MDKAIARLKSATVHGVDVVNVNGEIFINNSSIGLYPSSLRFRNKFEKYLGKWLAAIIASIRAFVRLRTYNVTIDDETFRTPFVFVGNNQYQLDGVGGATRESLDKGDMSVFIARTSSHWALFKIALFALIGKARVLDEFDERKTKKLVIESRRKRLSVSHDGEVSRVKSPLVYEIKAGALRTLY
jgi:diacylglycerol kinase family enzyme